MTMIEKASRTTPVTRRAALVAGLERRPALLFRGCSKILFADKLTASSDFHHVLAHAETWTMTSQRFLLSGGAMAREYRVSDISPKFKPNGTLYPTGEDYEDAVNEDFATLAAGASTAW